MKPLKIVALFICIYSQFANAQDYVQKWEWWRGNFIFGDNNVVSAGNQRNWGVHLFNDAGFGIELHNRGVWGTALFTRNFDEAIWFGNYNGYTSQQQQFNPWMTMVSGKVGIGTTTPRDKLDIWGGTIQVTGADYNGTFVAGAEAGNAYMSCNSVKTIYISPVGNVGVGTNDTKGYKFGVNGNAIFNKVVVKAYPWADYVFNADYRLRPLSEVEQYIKQHHHLPEVVSAEEVEKNGLDVGDNQATLLKKIEELTLYMIDYSKKQQKLEAEVAQLKKENSELKKIVTKKNTGKK
jgi:hypothetical protein